MSMENKDSIQNVKSFPASKVVWISNGLEYFVEIFQHDQLALHSHLATMDVLQQHPRTRQQLLL